MPLHPESWVANYSDYLFSIALMKISSKESAEDLVHDTFVSAIKSRDQFRGDSSEKTWLVRILNNKIIDYYRKKDVMKDVSATISESESSFNASFFQADRSSEFHWKNDAKPHYWSDQASDSALDAEEFNRVLQDCLHKLPPKMRPVFVMKFMEELESDEICKELEISSSNYWVLIHRAKLVMRACLEKNWFGN